VSDNVNPNDQLLQSLRNRLRDILTTPIGGRVMRRSYGSRLMLLLDGPLNVELLGDIQAAVVEAIGAQEPRIRVSRVQVEPMQQGQSGKINLSIDGYYLPSNQQISLNNITL